MTIPVHIHHTSLKYFPGSMETIEKSVTSHLRTEQLKIKLSLQNRFLRLVLHIMKEFLLECFRS